MHSAFFLILILEFLRIGEAAPSNLQQIADDFRILSRVTNAIALQASVAKKEIKTHDFLSEVLKMDPKRFQPILNVDVQTVKSEMNRMYEDIRKPRNPHLSTEELRRTTGSLKNFLEALNNVDYFSEAIKTPSNVLQTAIKSTANSKIFDHECLTMDTKHVTMFLDLFNPEKKLPDQGRMGRLLQEAQKQYAKSLALCLKNLPKLSEDFSSLDFWKAKKKYDLLYEVKHYAYKFASLSKTILANVQNKFDTVPMAMDAMKSVWEEETRSKTKGNYEKITNNMENFLESLWQMRNHRFEDDDDPKTTYIAGFKDAKDLKNVFSDLRSPWFLKNIAKGTSTKNLTEMLKPFRGVSDEIVALETSFNQIVDNQKLFDLKVRNGVHKLIAISKTASNSESIKKLITDSKKILIQCLPKHKDNVFQQFETFDKEQQSTWSFIKAMETISNLDVELSKKLSKDSERIQTNLFLKSIINMSKEEWDPTNIYHTKMRLADLLEQYETQEGNVLETLTTIVNLAARLNNLKISSEKFIVKQGLKSVQEIVSNLELFKTMKCLKEHNYQAQELHDAFEQLKNVTELRNHTAIGNMNEYLLGVGKVQQTLTNIESRIAAIHSKRKPRDLKITIPPLPGAMTTVGTLGMSTRLLEEFEKIRQNREFLLTAKPFPIEVKDKIQAQGLEDWRQPGPYLKKLLWELNQLDVFAKSTKNGTLLEMVKIFEKASEVSTIGANRGALLKLYYSLDPKLNTNEKEASDFFGKILSLDLDFARYQVHLTSAPLAVGNLKNYFDEIFGHSKVKTNSKPQIVEKYIQPPVSWIAILGICLGLIFSIFLIFVIVYGCTESGKNKYRNWYLYYFGKQKEFEKRWRYSKFMDSVNDKNWVLDAVREGNKTSLLKALKNGAYVDVYNTFGNTALHAATKLGHPDLVALLIKHGADRTLLNAKNRIPEQMIPPNYQKTHKDKVEQYEKIRAIYKKYKKKKFRKSVPQLLPWTSFHVFIEDRTEDSVTEKFMKEFLAIASDEAMPTTTHCVVKTDKNGILETENLELLVFIFNGVIIVQEKWMAACLEDGNMIEQDSKFLVEKVKYKGVVYNTVLKWSEAMAKGSMPFLMGAYVAVVMMKCDNLLTISALVNTHGGTMLNEFPLKRNFVKNSHPYLHAHLGPLFLIHDGTIDLTDYLNDEDKMYTLFTEEEFIAFMLKREIKRDENENPISAWKDVK